MFIGNNHVKDGLPMRVAICDDNLSAIAQLRNMISDYFALVNKTCEFISFHSPEALLNTDLTSVHIIFLDIDMPNINGIDAAAKLRNDYPNTFIVFVTSWIEYAPAGYRVNAFRYILKQRLASELPACLDAIRDTMARNRGHIQLPGKECPIEVSVDEILFIEGSSTRSITLHFLHSSPVESKGKLSDIANRLEDKGFLRIQRSYVVNMRHVLQIKGYKAYLKDGTNLKVSEKDYPAICQRYLLWKGQQL